MNITLRSLAGMTLAAGISGPAQAERIWSADWVATDTLVQRAFVVDASATGELSVLASRDRTQSAKNRLIRNDASGARRWERRVQEQGTPRSIRTDAEGRTFARLSGTLIAFDAEGRRLWSHAVSGSNSAAPLMAAGNRAYLHSGTNLLEFDRGTGLVGQVLPSSFQVSGAGIDTAGGLVAWGRDATTPSGSVQVHRIEPGTSAAPRNLGMHTLEPLRAGDRIPADSRGALLLGPTGQGSQLAWLLPDGSEQSIALPVPLQSPSAWPVSTDTVIVVGVANIADGAAAQYEQRVLRIRGNTVLDSRIAEPASPFYLSGRLAMAPDGALLLATTINDSACRNTRLRRLDANGSTDWTFDLGAATGYCGDVTFLPVFNKTLLVGREAFDAQVTEVSASGLLSAHRPIGPQVVDVSMESVRRINVHAQGRVVVTSTAEAPSADPEQLVESDALMASFGRNGERLWSYRGDFQAVDYAYSSFVLADDSSLLLSLGSSAEQLLQTTAVRINPDGTEAWSTPLDPLDEWAVYAPAMRQMPSDGRIVLFGSRRTPYLLVAGGVSKMAIEILDQEGNLLATGGDDALFFATARGLALTSDERLLVFSQEQSRDEPYSYWARAFDTRDGSLLWRQQIDVGVDRPAFYGAFQSDPDRLGMVLDYFEGEDNLIRLFEVDGSGVVYLGTPVRPDVQPFTHRSSAPLGGDALALVVHSADPDSRLYLGRLSRAGGDPAWRQLDVPGDVDATRMHWDRGRYVLTTHSWVTENERSRLSSRIDVFHEDGGGRQIRHIPEYLASIGGGIELTSPRFVEDQWTLAGKSFDELSLLPAVRVWVWNVPVFASGFE